MIHATEMSGLECSDSELVAQSLAGRREAFRQIVERYQNLICSLAYSATGSIGRSEDLSQETFVTAWKKLAELREPAKLRPWLCGIVRFLIGREIRRQGREPTEPLEAVEEVASSEPAPPEQAISREEQAILWRSLEGIPEIYREPMVLFYREHQSVQKVAEELELTEEAVRQRLSRGRNLLREQMAAFVEQALAKSSPGKAFTVGVVAALPVLAGSGKAAAAGAAIKGASTGTAATGLKALTEAIVMTGTTKGTIAAVVALGAVLLAAVTTYEVVQNQPPAPAQNPAPAVAANQPVELASIHIRGRLRAPGNDNFVAISPDSDFVTVDIWKQFEPKMKWRAERPGRVAVMDGQSALVYLPAAKIGWKIPGSTPSAFDTDWLQKLAGVSKTIEHDIAAARGKGWKADVAQEQAVDGRAESVVTIESKSGLPDTDYLKNKDFYTADLRSVYRFDQQTNQLEGVQIYLQAKTGEVLVFESTQVECNQAIDPALFHFDLPAGASWGKEMQRLPDNAKYAAMTPKQAAQDFLEACGRKDWDEAQKFESFPLTDEGKEYLGGLEIVSLGEPFKSKMYAGWFVPYEIKLPPQTINVRLSNANSAKRYVITGLCNSKLQVERDLKWLKEPEVLSNNDVYAKMSPVDVAKACFQALAKSDFVEVAKFVPEDLAKGWKSDMEESKKKGEDVSKEIPVVEEGEAVWSAEQSAYFVKCFQPSQTMKQNMALRKDNPARRWEVDGGI